MSDSRLRPKQATACSRGEAWWYEDKRGIEIFHRIETKGDGYIRTDTETIRIPWSHLIRAAQRSSGREIVVKR